MKNAAFILALFLVGLLASCSSKDYNHQPWMPKKVTGKSHHSHKKAQYTRKNYDLY